MIPLRDDIPHKRFPLVTINLIVVNVVFFLYELSLDTRLQGFISVYGFVPVRFFSDLPMFYKVMPLFSSMFLHAGWWHLIGNCWFLWIFGDNVEDTMGHVGFFIFYLICGVIAMFVHALFNLSSNVPTIGASGAIAGVLGAYFLLFPKARVKTLMIIVIFYEVIDIPAYFFLGFWFLYQFFLGVLSGGVASAGVAFWAHVGGFVAGMFFLLFFRRSEAHEVR